MEQPSNQRDAVQEHSLIKLAVFPLGWKNNPNLLWTAKWANWFVIWNRHFVTTKKNPEQSFLNYQQSILQGHQPKLESAKCPHSLHKHRLGHYTLFLWQKSTMKPDLTSAQQLLVEQLLQAESLEKAEGQREMIVVVSRTQLSEWQDTNERWDWGEKTGRKERLQSQELCKMVRRNQRQSWVRQCLFQAPACPLQRKGLQWLASQMSYSCDAVGEIPLERLGSADRKDHWFLRWTEATSKGWLLMDIHLYWRQAFLDMKSTIKVTNKWEVTQQPRLLVSSDTKTSLDFHYQNGGIHPEVRWVKFCKNIVE